MRYDTRFCGRWVVGMTGYGASSYGDALSAAYDELYGDFAPPAAQLSFLTELAGAGPAVEVGSGTGRVAVPLAAAGVPVVGVDASAEMTRLLASRAEAEALPIEAVEADAADFHVGRRVPLVFAVFNTFFLLADASTQKGFLARAARTLESDGRLVIETFVPRLGQLPDGPHPGELPANKVVTVKQRRTDRLVLFAAVHDAEEQTFDYHEVVLADGAPVRLFPGSMRYHWPREIDAMATAAGLRLAGRWGDWDRRPYTGRSRKHVSVYRLA